MPVNSTNFTRRQALGGAAALAGALGTFGGTRFAAAQDAGMAEGPLVWLAMDQQGLDDAYNQRAYAPAFDGHLARRVARNEAAGQALGEFLRGLEDGIEQQEQNEEE
jgi:hypothetical protein